MTRWRVGQSVVGILLLLVFSSCQGPSDADTGVARGDQLPEILERGTLRAGYFVGAPYFMKDPETEEVSGIFADVLSLMCDRLNLTLTWTEEVGYGQIPASFDSGKFDVFGSGVWVNAARARAMDFSRPVLFDAVSVFGRTEDNRFSSMADINSDNVTISTMDGEMSALIANSDFPEARQLALPQTADFTQMILNVTNRKADVVILGLAPAKRFQDANPDSIQNLSPDDPLRVFPTAFAVPLDSYPLKRMLDLTLLELMYNGDIDRIIDRYEEVRGSHLRVVPDYETELN